MVVVSADATAAHIEAALTAGAAHYVTKPVNLASFLAILDELLDDHGHSFWLGMDADRSKELVFTTHFGQ